MFRSGSLHAMAARLALLLAGATTPAAENVFLTQVPDYEWYFGCFGTATGNLMGFWDRHGFPDFYTGPTRGGVAPLTTFGANGGIRSLWASEGGFDGRAFNNPGHVDDYWVEYESVARDPYLSTGRTEHVPDCTGDFIGLNQNKWADLAGECEGNVDGYSFNFFDRDGRRRDNFTPAGGIPDIQSGLRAWTRSRGYDADTFSQLTEFNPDAAPGQGFTFADLKGEIDAGYPVLLFMQPFNEFSRTLFGRPNKNPNIHAMLAYGYLVQDDGTAFVRYRTSWASGDNQFSAWNAENWTPNGDLNLPLRGVIGFHPRPVLREVQRTAGGLRLRWEGPQSIVRDDIAETERPALQYHVQRSDSLTQPLWTDVAGPVTGTDIEIPACCSGPAFFRLRLQPTVTAGSSD